MNVANVVRVEVVNGVDVIGIVGAIATFVAVVVALYLGVASLRQNAKIQKRQHRHRLLDEIIGWAIDASKCIAEASPDPLPAEAFENPKVGVSWARLHLINQKDACLVVSARIAHIKAIASAFGDSLESEVEVLGDTLTDLKTILNDISRSQELLNDLKLRNQEFEDKSLALRNAADAVIRDAAGEMTTDIDWH